jgi:hypothetical protein
VSEELRCRRWVNFAGPEMVQCSGIVDNFVPKSVVMKRNSRIAGHGTATSCFALIAASESRPLPPAEPIATADERNQAQADCEKLGIEYYANVLSVYTHDIRLRTWPMEESVSVAG